MADLTSVKRDGGVEVMKASAGSGKTYSLAREYIRVILTKERGAVRTDPAAFRHVLAVTFTNKATAEMKSRIIDELDTLANCTDKSDFRDYLLKECGFESVKELAAASSAALSAILNDYGSFSVCTIDKFFQRVLKAFVMEIGESPDYQIDLDRDSLVQEAADRVLDSLSEETPQLLDWLARSSAQLIEEGCGNNVKPALKTFASGYLSEVYGAKVKAGNIDLGEAFSEHSLSRLQEICSNAIKKFDPALRQALADAAAAFEANASDLKYPSVIQKLRNFSFRDEIRLDETAFGKTFLEGAEDGGKFFGKGKGTEAQRCALQSAAAKVLSFSDQRLRDRNSAILLRRQIYIFRVADALRQEFDALLKEKHVFGIEDTNRILRNIIGDTDAPFIYEKLGVRYRHFLLDEFQDTSRMQWENFLPLLKNSISEGCYNLVVGDVKQSIYRWRNADWHILDAEVQASLRNAVENPLEDNWRSARNIVEFNNGFYKSLSGWMSAQIGFAKIEEIYSGVRQNVKDKVKVPGSVEVTFCASEDMDGAVAGAVGAAVDRGFQLKDIAVLVRSNADGARYARAVKDAGYDVITNDSLTVGSSLLARRLAAQLHRLNNPAEKVLAFNAEEFDEEPFMRCRTLEDAVEEMLRQIKRDYDAAAFAEESAYVLAFMDLVRDFESKNGNSLDGFLKFWEESGRQKSISSATGINAVTIITIHKAKGLDYPFAVVPFPSKNEFYKAGGGRTWEMPDTVGTSFGSLPDALYNVQLSEKSEFNIFRENYRTERQMSFVDSANTAYVATTRASEAMHIVCPKPSAKFLKNKSAGDADSFSKALYLYVTDPSNGFAETVGGDGKYSCLLGEIRDKWVPEKKASKKPEPAVTAMDLVYDCSEKAAPVKVKVKSDSRDFFSEIDASGYSASNRVRGSVLHRVLETVYGPQDLYRSLAAAVDRGELTSAEASEAEAILAAAISEVEGRGWFPGEREKVRDERSILSLQNDTTVSSRPDRVVFCGGHVDIIDYKFGKPEASYITQVGEYVKLYRSMGYGDVRGYLWYISERSEVIQVV